MRRKLVGGLAGLVLAGAVLGAFGQAPSPTAVGGQFHVVTSGERTTLNRTTGKLISTVDVALFNLGGRTMTTPLHLVVNLDIEGTNAVTMPGALGGLGVGPYGTYYVDGTDQFPGGSIAPNAEAATTLTFVHDRGTRFRYTVVPHATLVEVRPPRLSLPGSAFTVPEGGTVMLSITASDPDGEQVTLGAEPVLSNATFITTADLTATGTLHFAPNFEQAGTYALTFSATDPLGLSDQKTVLVTVSNVNRAPFLTGPATATVAEGELLTLSFTATDPDGDPLFLTAVPLPDHAVLVNDTALFYIAPDFTQAGVYPIDVWASDGSLISAAHRVTLTVTDVLQGAPGDTNALTLTVNPVANPSLLTTQRLTGHVNNTGALVRAASTMALITGLTPALVEQGQTRDVVLTGLGTGDFQTHFGADSLASFGPGVVVNALVVSNANLAVATVTVPATAKPGARPVTVITSNETAVSIVGFMVSAGDFDISGTLIDAATSNAIANAIITIQGTGYTTVSGADGSFSFTDLPPGDYLLVINPPDHEPVTQPFSAAAGQSLVLDPIPTAATVFDPSAPASVSLLSVIGRGAGTFAAPDLERTQLTIRDALLLCGGKQAGVLDAFGNQLNPAFTGPGLVSQSEPGVRMLAESTDRGQSVGLVDLLMPLSFGMAWTNGSPFTLAEWLDALQAGLQTAWQSPNAVGSALPILIFNQGATLSPTPPTLTPDTRLNPLQTYLFMMSALSHAYDPAGTNTFNTLSLRSRQVTALPGTLDDPPPPAPPVSPWNGYWRGMTDVKDNFISTQISSAVGNFAMMSAVMMVNGAGGMRSIPLTLPVLGLLGTEIASAFGNIAVAARVPEPPKILSAVIYDGPQHTVGEPGAPRVRVTIRRSPSDPRNDPRYFYTLYRFRSHTEGRQLVNFGFSTNPAATTLDLLDLQPFPGSTFYAVTLTRVFDPDEPLSVNEINNTIPWWNVPNAGITTPSAAFLRTRQKLVSDYSDPYLMYVGSPASSIPVNDIEVDPHSDAVYYALRATNVFEQLIYRFDDLGRGDVVPFGATGFAPPGYDGLAIDAQGDLYSHNKASDAMFGGRLFRFSGENGARDFVGSVNYYSRDLAFANPVDAYGLSIGPPGSPGFSDQDLYTVDMLAGQIKRAPVKATADPFRRVGQPYAAMPFTGRPIDMEHDAAGNTHLLLADAAARLPFFDREKGPTHIPPGAPIKQDCPPKASNPFIDPVYLFSGEYYEDCVDLHIPGRGLDFQWVRKYRSKIGENTAQGNNWDYAYNIHLSANTNTGGVVVHDGHTRADEYQRSGTNTLWTLPEFFRELTRNPDGSFVLEFEDKGRWEFLALDNSAAQGRIQASVDRHGNRLQFFYDAQGRLERIRDTLDRDIHVFYNAAGLIDSLVDFAGRAWRYEYYGAGDALGNVGDLKAIIGPPIVGTPTGNDFPDGRRKTYTYSTGHAEPRLNGNLLTVTDGRHHDPSDPRHNRGPFLRNIYATNTTPTDVEFDRVIRQVWGEADDIIDITYTTVFPTAANGGAILKTILNDREGHVKEFFWNARNTCTVQREYTGTALRDRPTTDTANRPVGKRRATDPDYFETRYEWNADGLKRREFHPNGNITEWVYESDLDPSAPARSRANVREIRRLPGTHNPAGDQASIVERFEYDTSFGRGCCGFNFVTRQTDAQGAETLKFYDPVGNLTQVVNRINTIVEDYTYNAFGQRTTVISPDNGNGHRRRDRMTYYTTGPQRGYLHQVIMDDGHLNLTTTYDYDLVGNTVRIVDARGHDSLIVRNALNEVVRTLTPEVADGSGVRYAVDNHYDANGNLVRQDRENRDANGVLQTNTHFTITFAYDVLNVKTRRVEEVDETRSVATEYVYDRNRNLVLTRLGEAVAGRQPNNVMRVMYDERDKVWREVRAEGSVEQTTSEFDYDGNGNLVRTQDGLEQGAQVSTFVFDAYNRKVRADEAMGNYTLWNYNANCQPVRMAHYGELTDGPGGGTNNVLLSDSTYAYDDMDRRIESVSLWFDPRTGLTMGGGAVRTRSVYNACSQVIEAIDHEGRKTRLAYDTANRLVVARDAGSNAVHTVFDASGNTAATLAMEWPSDGGPALVFMSTNTFDNLNRMTESLDSAGNRARFAYNSRNNVTRTEDGRANVTRHEYDGLGRLMRTVRELTASGVGGGAVADTIAIRQDWDDSSRLRSRVDGNGNTTQFGYDAQNRPTTTTLADGRIARVTYDARNNVVTSLDFNGTAVTNHYDGDDRLLLRTIAPGPGVAADTTFESYTYDGLARVVRAENNATVVTRSYDSLGRLMAESQNGDWTRYTYDPIGNLIGLGYPGGLWVTNTHDTLDRLVAVRDDSGPLASYGYAGPARVTRRTHTNNTELRVEYDAARRVIRTVHTRDPAGSPIAFDARTYAWDPAYNKRWRGDATTGITNHYAYDSVSRLVRTQPPAAPAVSYVLDRAGNRSAVTNGPAAGAYAQSSVMPEPADAPVNQYTTTPFGQRTYDGNGNLLTQTGGAGGNRGLRYDYRNQLVSLTNAATGAYARYTYDVFGRRLERQVFGPGAVHVHYRYDGQRVIEERDAAMATRATYVYGMGLDERLVMHRGGQTFHFHGDDQGNVTSLTDGAGQLAEQYRYDDYGQHEVRNGAGVPLAASATGNPYRFTGREFDPESGFHFYRTRYLDSASGRFISRDVIGDWGDALGMGNAFTYAGNNPWSRNDAGGTSAAFAGGLGVGAGESVVHGAVGIVTLPFAAVAAAASPVQTWNGLSAAMTRVAFHPDGIAAGYAHLLFPDLLDSAYCWEYTSEFERGRVLGKAGADVLQMAIGAGQLSAAARAVRLARLNAARRLRSLSAVDSGATEVTRGLRYQAEGTYWDDAFDPIVVPPKDVDDLLLMLEGYTDEVDELVAAARRGMFDIELLEDDMYKMIAQMDDVADAVGYYDGKVNKVFLNRQNASQLRSTAVHEFKHGWNKNTGAKHAQLNNKTHLMQEETTAHMAQFRFEVAAGLRKEMPHGLEVREGIRQVYRGQLESLPHF